MAPIGSLAVALLGVALLEEEYHCRGGLLVLIYAQDTPSVPDHFLLRAQDGEISATSGVNDRRTGLWNSPPWLIKAAKARHV